MSGKIVPFPPRHRGHIEQFRRELIARETLLHADIMDQDRTEALVKRLGPTAVRELYRKALWLGKEDVT